MKPDIKAEKHEGKLQRVTKKFTKMYKISKIKKKNKSLKLIPYNLQKHKKLKNTKTNE